MKQINGLDIHVITRLFWGVTEVWKWVDNARTDEVSSPKKLRKISSSKHLFSPAGCEKQKHNDSLHFEAEDKEIQVRI